MAKQSEDDDEGMLVFGYYKHKHGTEGCNTFGSSFNSTPQLQHLTHPILISFTFTLCNSRNPKKLEKKKEEGEIISGAPFYLIFIIFFCHFFLGWLSLFDLKVELQEVIDMICIPDSSITNFFGAFSEFFFFATSIILNLVGLSLILWGYRKITFFFLVWFLGLSPFLSMNN